MGEKKTIKSPIYLGVIGYPAFHSLSPYMHSEVMKALKIEGFYHAFEVDPQKFTSAIRGALSLGFTGLNITLPFKEKAYKISDVVKGDALYTGAVNTIRFLDGRIEGYNTDVYGFIKSLEKANFSLRKKRIAIFGSGGVARAILFASLKEGPQNITIFARNTKKAEKMIEQIEKLGQMIEPIIIEKENIKAKKINEIKFEEFDIIINATSLGWKGENIFDVIGKKPSKLSSREEEKKLFYDTVYMETEFLKTAKSFGYKIMDGKWMLVLQGAKSFEIWTGIYPPEEIMMRAIIQQMRKRGKR